VLIAHGFVAKVARAVTGAGFDDFFEWQLANGTVCELALTGTAVTILAREAHETFEVPAEMEAELLESIAQADGGGTISANELLQRLRRAF
jgi:hypothetical protein